MCAFGEAGNCIWGEGVAVAAGIGTDAQERFLKTGGSPDGQSQQQSCFSLYFTLDSYTSLMKDSQQPQK